MKKTNLTPLLESVDANPIYKKYLSASNRTNVRFQKVIAP